MHEVIFASGWDTALLMVPFVGLMALSVFRLDERIATPRPHKKTRREFCHQDRHGNPFLFDPDGKPWH
jgi:hypothetical protein